MKTSNKLLTGAFVIIVIAMIVATLSIKNETKKAIKQNNNIQIEQRDSIQSDSTTITINLK